MECCVWSAGRQEVGGKQYPDPVLGVRQSRNIMNVMEEQ